MSRFLYHHAFEQHGAQAQGQQATADLGFVPTGEMEDDEVSARLNVIPGTQT